MTRRRVVAEETVTTTRRVEMEEDDTAVIGPVAVAGGWHAAVAVLTPRELRLQREGQVAECMRYLQAGAHAPPWDLPEIVRSAVTILRAGPGAPALEAQYGRLT